MKVVWQILWCIWRSRRENYILTSVFTELNTLSLRIAPSLHRITFGFDPTETDSGVCITRSSTAPFHEIFVGMKKDKISSLNQAIIWSGLSIFKRHVSYLCHYFTHFSSTRQIVFLMADKKRMAKFLFLFFHCFISFVELNDWHVFWEAGVLWRRYLNFLMNWMRNLAYWMISTKILSNLQNFEILISFCCFVIKNGTKISSIYLMKYLHSYKDISWYQKQCKETCVRNLKFI